MANESSVVELGSNGGRVVEFTVGDNTIIKGALLTLVDPRTASGATSVGSMFAGIAAADKEVGDGATTLGCYTDGIHLLSTSGATISAGNNVMLSGANFVDVANAAASGAVIVGTALNDVNTNSENCEVDIGRK